MSTSHLSRDHGSDADGDAGSHDSAGAARLADLEVALSSSRATQQQLQAQVLHWQQQHREAQKALAATQSAAAASQASGAGGGGSLG